MMMSIFYALVMSLALNYDIYIIIKYQVFEFLYGIPGTIGGAVFMNAGAFEKEILDSIYSIDLLDINGRLQTIFNKDIQYTYRNSGIDPRAVIVSIKLHNPRIKFDSSIINNLNYKEKLPSL